MITGVGPIIQQHHPQSLQIEVFQFLVVGQGDAAVEGSGGGHHTCRWEGREGGECECVCVCVCVVSECVE